MMRPAQSARTSIITALLCVIFFWIAVSLYRIQILQFQFFSSYGSQQYTATISHPPARGIIYDRYGQPIALNTTAHALCILPGTLAEADHTHAIIKQWFPQYAERCAPGYVWTFTYLTREATPDMLTYLREHPSADIHILEEPRRFYPYSCCASFVGTTDIDTTGIAGLELRYDEHLRGARGSYTLQRDARKRSSYFHKTVHEEGRPGAPLHTTIDAHMQFIIAQEIAAAAERMHADEIDVLVLDPKTGDILAMAQYPCYEPHGPAAARDPGLLTNRLVCFASELGSVMKAFCALAAFDEGVVTPDEIIDCRNTRETTINGMPVTTIKEHGCIPFRDVLRVSNNIGTAQVSLRLGKNLYTHYRALGFGECTGIELPGEQTGSITPPKQWSKATPLSLSYGYEIRSSLVQLGQAFSIIARDGMRITPRILKDSQRREHRVYEPAVCQTLKDILNMRNGSLAYLLRDLDDYTVYGKTGTAKLYDKGGYRDDYSLFTFVGCLERGDYQRVIVVHVQKPTTAREYASTVAAPLWSTLAHRIAVHDNMHHDQSPS